MFSPFPRITRLGNHSRLWIKTKPSLVMDEPCLLGLVSKLSCPLLVHDIPWRKHPLWNSFFIWHPITSEKLGLCMGRADICSLSPWIFRDGSQRACVGALYSVWRMMTVPLIQKYDKGTKENACDIMLKTIVNGNILGFTTTDVQTLPVAEGG